MSPKLQAYLLLKSINLINRATDAKYIFCHAGEHVFHLLNGDVCSVDLVIKTVRRNGVVIHKG